MMFLFEVNVLKCVSLALFSLIAIVIWNVIVLPLLMEKIFSLILVFCLLSFWLLLNGLEFLPLVILLLYVGAIAVLFLFVVMIVNPDFTTLLEQKQTLVKKLTQMQQSMKSLTLLPTTGVFTPGVQLMLTGWYSSYVVFGILVGSFLGGLFSWYSYFTFKFQLNITAASEFQQLFGVGAMEPAIVQAAFRSEAVSPVALQMYYHPAWFEQHEVINIGLLLYTKYGIALLIIGAMLLVSMMGAIILTLRQTTFTKSQSIYQQGVRYLILKAGEPISLLAFIIIVPIGTYVGMKLGWVVVEVLHYVNPEAPANTLYFDFTSKYKNPPCPMCGKRA